MNQITSDFFDVEFTFDFQEKEIIKCNRNEKLINIFKDYAKKKGLRLNNIYFLCNGNAIDDFEQTFDQLANEVNIENKEIKILVFKAGEENSSKINVFFLEIFNTKKYISDPNEKIKVICEKYEKESNFRPNSLIYIYEGKELDLNKTFADYINDKNDIFIKVYPKELIYIIFSYLGTLYSIECYKADQFEDICEIFASKNNINKNKVLFKYQGNSINQKQTLKEFLKGKNIININDIKIDVIDSHSPHCFTVHKVKIIIISIIVAAAVTVSIVVYVKTREEEPNPDEDNDYFIKTKYLSKNPKETIKLISDNFDLNKIKNIIIDGSKIAPKISYTFNTKGEHDVYYYFESFSRDSLSHNGKGIFSGFEILIYAEFTEYNKFYPDVSFNEMFKNCINLESVFLSIIKLDYIPGKSDKNGQYYSSEYFNSINYMFYICSSLNSVYFPSSNFYPQIMSYAFAFCSSLIFAVNIPISIHVTHMNNLFYNCKSIQVLNFTLFNSENNIVRQGVLNTSNLFDISQIFSNCSSLISIDLSWILTTNVSNYEGLFYNWDLLYDINIVTFTHNDLPDEKLTIFNDKIPLEPTIYMNEEFYDRIEDLIPKNLSKEKIEIFELIDIDFMHFMPLLKGQKKSLR